MFKIKENYFTQIRRKCPRCGIILALCINKYVSEKTLNKIIDIVHINNTYDSYSAVVDGQYLDIELLNNSRCA